MTPTGAERPLARVVNASAAGRAVEGSWTMPRGQIAGHRTVMLGKLHKVDSDPWAISVRLHKDTKPSKLDPASS